MIDSRQLKAFILISSVLILSHLVLFIRVGSFIMTATATVFSGIQLSLLAFLIFKKKSAVCVAHFLLISFGIYTAVVCVKTGGFFSLSLIVLFFIPVFVQLFEQRTIRIAYYAATALVAVFLYWAPLMGFGASTDPAMVNISIYRGYQFFIMLACLIAGLNVISSRSRAMYQEFQVAVKEQDLIRKEAQDALKIKDQFLANMSHEIRNPMNGIIGMMHVLLDSDLQEEQKRYANIVYSSARALLTIVNDILDLSKIEAGKLELDNRAFDLEISIKDIVSLPQLQARQKGIEFNYSIDPTVPCLFQGDIGRIRQVLNNLTGNAIKFTDSGEVTLSISLKEDHDDHAVLHFSIEDTGIGIPEDQIASLFHAFTQADLTITKRFGGTGLGLSISKLLVEKMGGEMGVQSIEMIGSTFWFTLLLKKQEESNQREEKISPVQSLEKCRTLVLSDGASLGINFEKNLDALPLEYEQAFDETEALEMLKWARDEENAFQLIILETKEFDGAAESLGRKIKGNKLFRNIRLMLLTSIGKKGDAKRFEEIGFSAYLSKPVEKDLLHDAIKAVLSRPLDDGERNLPIITRYTILENKKRQSSVLIVDDIQTNRITARALISKQGFVIDEAENGIQALEKYKDTHYDLILMDCQMPGMDGFEATRQIRAFEKEKNAKKVPIIAMTGNAFESDRLKCLEAGMDDFIAKPVEPEVLYKIVRSNLIDTIGLFNDRPGEGSPPDQTKAVPEPDTPQMPVSTAPDCEDDVPVFDRKKLLERFGQDFELVEIVLESFLVEAKELLDDLSGLAESKDAESVRLKAHALKGSCANVNAERLRTLSLDLETLARNENLDQLTEKIAMLESEYELFIRETQI